MPVPTTDFKAGNVPGLKLRVRAGDDPRRPVISGVSAGS